MYKVFELGKLTFDKLCSKGIAIQLSRDAISLHTKFSTACSIGLFCPPKFYLDQYIASIYRAVNSPDANIAHLFILADKAHCLGSKLIVQA